MQLQKKNQRAAHLRLGTLHRTLLTRLSVAARFRLQFPSTFLKKHRNSSMCQNIHGSWMCNLRSRQTTSMDLKLPLPLFSGQFLRLTQQKSEINLPVSQCLLFLCLYCTISAFKKKTKEKLCNFECKRWQSWLVNLQGPSLWRLTLPMRSAMSDRVWWQQVKTPGWNPWMRVLTHVKLNNT